tara:strand:- start:31 stop:1125 length:1095 start_codon:yes stop_codon:yes gene_type:complete
MLITFQFTVSIVLIFCLLVIFKQVYYAKHKGYGFTSEQLLNLQLPNMPKEEVNKITSFYNKLQEYPQILNMSLSNGIPGQINSMMGIKYEEDKYKSFDVINVDSTFMKTFDLQLVQGRLPQQNEKEFACVINKAAYDFYGWDNLEGKKFNNGREGGYDVVGVVENFHVNSIHKSIEPLTIIFNTTYNSHLSLRLNGSNAANTIAFIEDTWKETLGNYVFKYEFYDDWFAAQYRKEERFAKTIGLFSILAIVISCTGLLGLAIFNSQLRVKEIGIRKVLGASVSSVLILLCKNYVKLIVLAFAVAIPIANYFMSEWLGEFAYKVELNWWYFALPGIAVLVIALLTISGQSLKAAIANPADCLRNE